MTDRIRIEGVTGRLLGEQPGSLVRLAGCAAAITLAVTLTGCSPEKIFPGTEKKDGSRTGTGTESEVEGNGDGGGLEGDGSADAGSQDGEFEDRLTLSGGLPIEDNFSLYENWDYEEVTTMYLTVRSGNESDGTNHTWEEVNTYSVYYYQDMGLERYKVEGLLQVGDENGPLEGELGYNQYVPNAVVQIRGQTSSKNAQKNYRISLKDGKGEWEGMNTVNLNKHVGDGTRITNMLCYRLMTQIDGMISARTKFVHLYVKDETASGNGSGEFEDYGLYTFVEQMNRSYLRRHNLDRNGQMYKVNFFEFNQYEELMLKSDSRYDEGYFEYYLEIKGDDDHTKLLQMLDELNDYSIPIEETFAKWFDGENYFSWLAFHILVGNRDTSSRNHFLYSPNNVNKFYFISWDNDAAFRSLSLRYNEWKEDYGFETGVSNYWGNTLHRRVLQSPQLRERLDERIIELKTFLSPEKMKEETEKLAAIVKPYLYSMPDAEYAPYTAAQFDELVEAIPGEIENNYQKYVLSLKKPMPFFLGTPAPEGGKLRFTWENAYDLDAETITYRFELADNYLFNDCIYQEEDMLIPETAVDMLAPGQYFYRVTAENTSGYEQMAFDYYNSERGKEHGMQSFWITEDGQVQVETYEME